MLLSRKHTIIVLLTILVGIAMIFVIKTVHFKNDTEITEAYENSGVPGIEQYVRNYEVRKQNISAKIQNLNRQYAQTLKNELDKEVQDILQNTTLEQPEMLNTVLAQIEQYQSNNVFWDKNLPIDIDSWSMCRLTRGLTLNLLKPKTSPDIERIKQEKLEIILEYNSFGPAIPDAQIYNTIVFNNAQRYLYKFFEGRIGEKDLDDIFSRLLNSKDSSSFLSKTYNGVDYNFEYSGYSKELRIIFKWD